MKYFEFGKLFLSVAMLSFDKAISTRAVFQEASGYVDQSRYGNLMTSVSHRPLCISDIITSKNFDVSVYILNGILDMPIHQVQQRINTRMLASDDATKIGYYTGIRRLKYPILQ